ncbi:MAG: CHAD domain-containing protein [Gammaproteobacteria bacterium]|nr:CHAD domain-containing protein [Gammaproteobacteria bacterium]
MAYVIRRSEPVADEVRRILAEQNLKALKLLEHWQLNPREHVHAARQTFKRLRALLRLIRPGADYVFRVENRFYRDLGRSLACLRDSDAVVEALSVIESSIIDAPSREALELLRTGLEKRAARRLADPALDIPGRVDSACGALRDATRRLRRTPLAGLGRKSVRSSAQKGLRRCEKSFGKVLLTGAAVDFHQWRQDVKCTYHHTRLMQELLPEWSGTYSPPLGRLAELLGHGQDLAVLEAMLDQQPDELGLDRNLQRIRGIVADCQAAVQDEARRLGVQIFLQPSVEPEMQPTAALPAPQESPAPPAAARLPGQALPEAGQLPANVVDFATHRAGEESR